MTEIQVISIILLTCCWGLCEIINSLFIAWGSHKVPVILPSSIIFHSCIYTGNQKKSPSRPSSSRKIPIGDLLKPRVSTLLTSLFFRFLRRSEAWRKIAENSKWIILLFFVCQNSPRTGNKIPNMKTRSDRNM